MQTTENTVPDSNAEAQFSRDVDDVIDRWASTDALSPAQICGILAMHIRLIQDSAIAHAKGQRFLEGMGHGN